MEMLLQSFDEVDGPLKDLSQWHTLLELLDEHVELHAHTVWCWCCLAN